MRSQMNTYCIIVVFATCFSVLITKVSGIYCVRCTSVTDPYCQLAGMRTPVLCPESHEYCVTTVIARKNNRGSRVRRGCSQVNSSGCRIKGGSYVCNISCQTSGCNSDFNFITGDLPVSAFIPNQTPRL